MTKIGSVNLNPKKKSLNVKGNDYMVVSFSLSNYCMGIKEAIKFCLSILV